MIDYLFNFPDEPTAKADPVIGTYYLTNPLGSGDGVPVGGWRGDGAIPNVQVGNQANHTPYPGFWLLIAKTAHDPALDVHPARQLVLDRDKANQGALPAQYIIYFNPSWFPSVISLLNACKFQPIVAGSKYDALAGPYVPPAPASP